MQVRKPTPEFTNAELEYYICNVLNRCGGCRRKLDNLKNIVEDRIDFIVCEERTVCGYCNFEVDYTAYGSSRSEQERGMFEMEFPKAAELIKKMIGLNEKT